MRLYIEEVKVIRKILYRLLVEDSIDIDTIGFDKDLINDLYYKICDEDNKRMEEFH